MARDAKETLRRYLRVGRESMLWKLDGLSEYDVRRPLTPTGTNLLGLVKHLAGVEYDYFGTTFDRPYDESLHWLADDAELNADMYATAGERRDDILSLYERATTHADATIDELDLGHEGRVPWWSDDANPVTLHWILVHVATETHRHAGHADILREQLDGAAGLRPTAPNLPAAEVDWWAGYVARVEAIARAAAC